MRRAILFAVGNTVVSDTLDDARELCFGLGEKVRAGWGLGVGVGFQGTCVSVRDEGTRSGPHGGGASPPLGACEAPARRRGLGSREALSGGSVGDGASVDLCQALADWTLGCFFRRAARMSRSEGGRGGEMKCLSRRRWCCNRRYSGWGVRWALIPVGTCTEPLSRGVRLPLHGLRRAAALQSFYGTWSTRARDLRSIPHARERIARAQRANSNKASGPRCPR